MKIDTMEDSNSTTSLAAEAPANKESAATASPSSSVVTKIASNDVLMGRGAAVIGNEGNRRFRKLIQKYKAEYDATRIRQEKDRIARKIVDTITSSQGRFLKKIETAQQKEFFQVPSGKAAWMIVKETVVLQKVKQAFRDDRRSFDEEPPQVQAGADILPSGLKLNMGESLLPPRSPLDSLLGDRGNSALLAYQSLLSPSLLMRQNASPLYSQQRILKAMQQKQLDSQMLSQLLASRQGQYNDHFGALRRQALSEQVALEENRRALLLQQVLARQAPAAPSSFLAGMQAPSAASSLGRQVTLRAQLAALANAPALPVPTPSMPASPLFR
jgi:hypothetical protein